MADGSELDPQRKQEIVDLDGRLERINHFELLGLQPGANSDEVRGAFRELSRKYHPDRFYGKNVGVLKPKIERIFKRIVEANSTLTDPVKREAYLAANPFVRAAVKAATGSHPSLQPVVERDKSPEELARDAERRSRLAKHPYLARVTMVQDLITKAREAVAKGEYSQAFQALSQATQIDDKHAEARTMLLDVRQKYEGMRAETDFKRALEAIDRGDVALALQALKAAVAANPKHHQAAFKVAQLLGATNAKEASMYAQKAVDADPRNIFYRLQLGRLLLEAGAKALAKKQFEEAARIDPNHPEVKKQGKSMWPF